jgi:hypothetical protein
MNGAEMYTSSEESNDKKRRDLQEKLKETKSIEEMIECKKAILLLDREDILNDLENAKQKYANTTDTLNIELVELDEALKQYK